jgi:hypothetical protein
MSHFLTGLLEGNKLRQDLGSIRTYSAASPVRQPPLVNEVSVVDGTQLLQLIGE